MTEPPRRRVPVAAEQSVREERRGFFRIAAILGVVIGIPLGVLGIPPLLNVFFDEPTVPVNGAYSEDGLTIWVESYEVDEGPPRSVTVTLDLRTAEPWAFDPEGLELEMSEGESAPLSSYAAPDVFEAGPEGTLVLRFSLAGADEDAEPQAVRFPEPKVRFALTEEDH
ncbi:MAG: hypothetical protein F4052_08300 [Dehalococcoidia bacterium]|nr:hypothetical protein [Dehalococcoidia bacterium]